MEFGYLHGASTSLAVVPIILATLFMINLINFLHYIHLTLRIPRS